jgi:hypothetical protein
MMISASSLAFPGSKTLAGWWRQLTIHKPLSFAVGYLFLHRVEAPVIFSHAKKIDRFSLLVLQALEMDARCNGTEAAAPLQRLQTRLYFDRPVILQILRTLQVEGLADIQPDGSWALSARGRLGIKNGEVPVESCERRVFHFLERCDSVGARSHPPHFLNMRGGAGTPWPPGDAYPFDVSIVRHCTEQAEAWKQQFGFPLDIRRIPDLADGDDQSAWQRIVVDRPERQLVVLALTAGANQPRLLGFAARQEGWVLASTEPVLALDAGWQEIFPELHTPSPEGFRQAWHAWAQPRGITEDQLAACTPEWTGHRLRVQAPASVLDHLRATRSEVLKGDSWILVGDGRVRTAANLEVVKIED